MVTRTIWDASLATLTPTARQRQFALSVAVVVLAATAIVIPYGAVQLRAMDGFIPATEAVVVVCDLVIAALLASQAVTIGSRGLLLLASGFLFDALIIVPHALTFPGAFAPAGLFGAGLQTTAWLYIFWHFGLPAAMIGYTFLPRETHTLTATTVYWSGAFIAGLVAVLTWITVEYGNELPALFADRRGFTPLANIATGFDFSVSVVALLTLLLRREKSVFDLWLTISVVVLVAELAIVTFVIGSRFSLGFYASRFLSFSASITVLLALLAETIQQDVRLARANLALQLERSRKLTSLDAALAAITHEARQPLSSIANNAEAAQLIIGGPMPDLNELREIAGDILDSSLRANEIFNSVRGLFGNFHEQLQQVDMNDVISKMLRGSRQDLDNNGITSRAELETDLPVVLGHKGQLQEVVINLISNAIDAMKSCSTARNLTVRTTKRDRDRICISLSDSGPGIRPEQLGRIFDPFVTTKKNGMGMGLAICRMIVERHGGQISVSSDDDGGARFEIVLPIGPTADLDQRPAKIAVAATNPRLLFHRPRRTADPLRAG